MPTAIPVALRRVAIVRTGRGARCPIARRWTAGPLLALAALTASPSTARAQAADRGPAAPLLGWLPAGTRALSMGDAAVASGDPDAVFYNPAGLVTARGVELGAQRYGRGATVGTMAVALPFAPGGLGIGVQLLDYGVDCAGCSDAVVSREGALAGARGPSPASAMAVTIGFGRTLFGVRLGATARYVEQRIPDARDGTLDADVGASMSFGRVDVGLAVQQIGGRIELAGERWQLPRRATLGAAFDRLPAGPFDVAGSAALSLLAGGDVTVGGGVEVGYTPLDGYTVAARAGLRSVSGGDVGPLSLGLALVRDRIQLEYAFQPLPGPDDLHRVGLRLHAR